MCKGKCYAYEELKRQLQDQCSTYLKLHPNKEIGKGRYTNKGEPVPNTEISEYLRGGIISTLAVFEAFLANIMAEAFDRIIYEHECSCGCTCSVLNDCTCICKVHDLKSLEALSKSKVCMHAFKKALQCDAEPSASSVAQRAYKVAFGQKSLEDTLVDHRTGFVSSIPLLHDFDEAFGKLLDPFEGNQKNHRKVVSDNIFAIADDEPINYLYLLDDKFHSKIPIENKETLCAILRLWYGIRCISADGVAEKTIHGRGGALKDFPKCHTCDSYSKRPVDDIVMLEKSRELCNLLDEILGELNHEAIQGEDYSSYPENYKTFLKVKRFPRIDVIQNISVEPELEEKKVKTVKLAEEHWSSSPDGNGEYPPAFGFYHMYRTYYFISCLQRGMYITYRELVRINQFILLLAFRIKLAVAKWLSECDDSEVMPELKGLWGYGNKEEVKQSIKEVETEHEERIKKIKQESNTKFLGLLDL